MLCRFLRQSAAAMAQGATRFERGMYFFLSARKAAMEMKCPFNWMLRTVPGTGHNNRKMAIAAVKEIFSVPPGSQDREKKKEETSRKGASHHFSTSTLPF